MQWVDEHFLRPLQRRIFRNFGYYDYSRQTFCVNAPHVNHLLDGEADPAVRQERKDRRQQCRKGKLARATSTPDCGNSTQPPHSPATPSASTSAPQPAPPKRRVLLRTSQGRIRLVKAEIKSAGFTAFVRRLAGKSLLVESVHIVCNFVFHEAERARDGTAREDAQGGEGGDSGHRGGADTEDVSSCSSYSSSAFAPPEEAEYDESDEDNAHGGGALGAEAFLPFAREEMGSEDLFRSCLSDNGGGGGREEEEVAEEGEGEWTETDEMFLSAVSAASSPTPPPTPPPVTTATAASVSARGRAALSRLRTMGELLRFVRQRLQGVSVSVDAFHATIRIPPAGCRLRQTTTAASGASGAAACPSSSLPAGTLVLHVSCLSGLQASIDHVESGEEADFAASVRLGDLRVYVHRVGEEGSEEEREVNLSTELDWFSLPLEDLVLAASGVAPAAAAPQHPMPPPKDEAVRGEGGQFSHSLHLAYVTTTRDVDARLGGTSSPPPPPAAADPSVDAGVRPGPYTEQRLYAAIRAADVTSVITPQQLMNLTNAADAVIGRPPTTAAAHAQAQRGGGVDEEAKTSEEVRPLAEAHPVSCSVEPVLLAGSAAAAKETDRKRADLLALASRKVEVATLAAATARVQHSRKFFELFLRSAALSLVTCDGEAAARAAVEAAWRSAFASPFTQASAASGSPRNHHHHHNNNVARRVWSTPLLLLRPVHRLLCVPHFTIAVAGVDVLWPNVDAKHAFPSSPPPPSARSCRLDGDRNAGEEEEKRAAVGKLFRNNAADPEVTARIERQQQRGQGPDGAQSSDDHWTLFAGVHSFQVLELRGLGVSASSSSSSRPDDDDDEWCPTQLLCADALPYALVFLVRTVASAATPLSGDTAGCDGSGGVEAKRVVEEEMYQDVVAVVAGQLKVQLDPDVFVVAARYAGRFLRLVDGLRNGKTTTRTGDAERSTDEGQGEAAPAMALPLPEASLCCTRTHRRFKLSAEFVDGRVRFPIPERRAKEEADARARRHSGSSSKGSEEAVEEEAEDFDEEYGDVEELGRRPLLQRLLRHLSAKSRRYCRDALAAAGDSEGRSPAALEELCFAHEVREVVRGNGRPRFLAEGIAARFADVQLTCTSDSKVSLQWRQAVAAIVDLIAPPHHPNSNSSNDDPKKNNKVSAGASHQRSSGFAQTLPMRGAVKELLRVDRSDDMSILLSYTDLVADGRVACCGTPANGGAEAGSLHPSVAPPPPAALRHVLTFSLSFGEVATQPLTQDDLLLTLYFVRVMKGGLSRARRVLARAQAHEDEGRPVLSTAEASVDASPRTKSAAPSLSWAAAPQAAEEGGTAEQGSEVGGGNAVWWREDASTVYVELHIRRVTLNLLSPRLSPQGTALGEPMVRCLSARVAAGTDFALLFHRYQLTVSHFGVAYLSCDGPALRVAGVAAAPCVGSTIDVVVRAASVTLAEHIAPLPHKAQASLVGRVTLVQSYTHSGAGFGCPADEDHGGTAPPSPPSREADDDSAAARRYVLLYPFCDDNPEGRRSRQPPPPPSHEHDHVCRVRIACRPTTAKARHPYAHHCAEAMSVDIDLRQLGLHHLPSHMGDAWLAVLKNYFVDRRSSAEEAASRAAEGEGGGGGGRGEHATAAAMGDHRGEGRRRGRCTSEDVLNAEVSFRVTDILWAYQPQGPRQTLIVFLAPHLFLNTAIPDFTLDPVVSVQGYFLRSASLYVCNDCDGPSVLEDDLLNRTGKGWGADLEAYGFVRLLNVHSSHRGEGNAKGSSPLPSPSPSPPPNVLVSVDRAPHAKMTTDIRVSRLHISAFAARDSLHALCKVAVSLLFLHDLRFVELPHVLVMRSNTAGALDWVGEEVSRSCAPMAVRMNESFPVAFLQRKSGASVSGGDGEARKQRRRRPRACLTSFPSVQSTSAMSTMVLAAHGESAQKEEPHESAAAPDGELPPPPPGAEEEEKEEEEEEEEEWRRRQFRLWRRTNAPRDVVLRCAFQETMQDLLSTPWPPPDERAAAAEAMQNAAEQAERHWREQEEWVELLLTDTKRYRMKGRQRTGRAMDTGVESVSTSSFESVEDNPMAAPTVVWRTPAGPRQPARAAASPTAHEEPRGEGLFNLCDAVSCEPHYLSGFLHQPESSAVSRPVDVSQLSFYLPAPAADPWSPVGAGGGGTAGAPPVAAAPGERTVRSGSPVSQPQRHGSAHRRILPPVEVQFFLHHCGVDVSLYDGCDLSDAASRGARRNLFHIARRSRPPPPGPPPPVSASQEAADARGASSSLPPTPTAAVATAASEQELERLHREGRRYGFGDRNAGKRLVLRLRGLSVQADLFAFGAEEQRWMHVVVEQATVYDCIAKSDVRTLLTASPVRPGDWVQTRRFFEFSWLNVVPRHASAMHDTGDRTASSPETRRRADALLYGSPEEEMSVRLQPISITWSGASLDLLLRLASLSDDVDGCGTPGRAAEPETFLPPPLFFRSFTVYPTVITISGSFDSDTGLMNAIHHGDKLSVMRNLPLLSWLSVKRLPLAIPHVTVTNCGTPALLLERMVADSQCFSIRFLLTVCCCVVQPLNAAAKVGDAAKGVLLAPMAPYRSSDSLCHALARASTTLAWELVSQSAHVGSMLANNTYRASRALLEALLSPGAASAAAAPQRSCLPLPYHARRGLPPAGGQREGRGEDGRLPAVGEATTASAVSLLARQPPPSPLDLYLGHDDDGDGDGAGGDACGGVGGESYHAQRPPNLAEGMREGQDELSMAVRDAALLASYSLGPDGRLVQLPAAGLRILMGLSGGATAALRGVRNASSSQGDLQLRAREADLYKTRKRH